MRKNKTQQIKIEKSRDSAIVSGFLNGNFSAPTHWPCWNQLVAEAFDTNFFYLIARDGDSVIGICPMHETPIGKKMKRCVSGQFHFIPFGGWIFSRPTTIRPDFFPVDYASYTEVCTLPLLDEFKCRYEGFEGNVEKRATLIVGLHPPEEDIWKALHRTVRKQVRKAHNRNVEIRMASTAEDLDAFYQLYLASSRRIDLPVFSRPFFESLINDCSDISVNIFMAYQKGIQLANLVTLSDKNYAVAWLGNNGYETKNEGQGDLLHWASFQKAKDRGCRYFDMGHIEPERLPHIYRFKKKFSTDERPILHFSIKTPLFKIMNKVLS